MSNVAKDRYNTVWLRNFEIYKDYVKKNSKLPVTNDNWSEVNIGTWLRQQRMMFREGKLDQVRIDLMDKFSVLWRADRDRIKAHRRGVDTVRALKQNGNIRSEGKTPLTDMKNVSATLIKKAIDRGITCCEDIVHNKNENIYKLFLSDLGKLEFSAAQAVYKDVSTATIRLIVYVTGGYGAMGARINMDNLDHRVIEALEGMPIREAKIIKLYFGYEGEVAGRLDECGKYLGIKESGARYLLTKAIRVMKYHRRFEKMITGKQSEIIDWGEVDGG